MTTLLIIEDDAILSETLRYNLERAGYTIETALDGINGLALARRVRPDLILLDLMLPGMDGFSLCRTLATEQIAPIIILTALSGEADRIAGLELGANDYVLKPFSMGELLARVRALLRWSERYPQVQEPNVVSSGPLLLDRSSRRAWYGDQEVTLSFKEFDLLVCLMRNAGVVLSRDLLIERVWGEAFPGSRRTVDVHIRWLREKIEPDPANPRMIQTVRRVGYRFQPPTSDLRPAGEP